LHATADATDYTTTTGTLNWAAGNNADLTIDLNINSDGVNESLERLIVRLVNPTGGATLGNLSTASAYLSDPGSAVELNFSETAVSMTERGFATVVAIVSRSGSAVGAASVDLVAGGTATAGADYNGNVPQTLSWADGDGDPKTVEISIVDDGTGEASETFTLALNNPTGATVGAAGNFTATIQDGSGTNLAPNAIAGGDQTRNPGDQVTLNGNQSNDPNGDTLSYLWTQTGGPGVTLNNAGTSLATFTAPNVSSDALLQFQLAVTDPGGLSDTAATTVVVTRPIIDPGGGSGGSAGVPMLLVLLVLVARRVNRTGRA
jgi:hypothetical protein